VLGTLTGCSDSSSGVQREPICVPGDDEMMFRTLTAQRWGACNSNVGLCLSLAADGSYSTIRGEGDYTISDEGRWNFLARDATSGVACLDDGSVIDFALTSGGLSWGLVGTLPPVDALSVAGDRSALPELLPADVFFQLTQNAWTKTNELDLYGYPTEMTLARDGTFTAAFRHGACEIAGTFSVVATNLGFELNPRAQPNMCDTRSGGTPGSLGASNDRPEIDGGVLRLYGASYREASAKTAVESLSYSSYGGYSLRVDARWDGPLTSAPRTWHFALQNSGMRVQTITSLAVSVTPVVETTNGYSTAGEPSVLVDRMLHEVVAAGHEVARDEEVAIGATGLLLLTVVVSSYDDVQRYDNQRSFILSL
jgi:hypothetical protein